MLRVLVIMWMTSRTNLENWCILQNFCMCFANLPVKVGSWYWKVHTQIYIMLDRQKASVYAMVVIWMTTRTKEKGLLLMLVVTWMRRMCMDIHRSEKIWEIRVCVWCVCVGARARVCVCECVCVCVLLQKLITSASSFFSSHIAYTSTIVTTIHSTHGWVARRVMDLDIHDNGRERVHARSRTE